jgi:hypothetical protein
MEQFAGTFWILFSNGRKRSCDVKHQVVQKTQATGAVFKVFLPQVHPFPKAIIKG